MSTEGSLAQLKLMSVVVADTGDFDKLKALKPQDSTTNPTLLYKAFQLPAYKGLVDDAINFAKKQEGGKEAQISAAVDKLFINFGVEILKVVPGRVSMELDARLSFDTAKTVERAHALLKLAKASGMDTSRILIKVASTWEGIQAVKQLQSEGIKCNMTLLFSLAQAVAAADAHAQLISPFVGRVTDFFKEKLKVADFKPEEDPGVKLVKSIFNYYKHQGIKTEIMGASFRSPAQVLALAGCDLLTISPELLEKLADSDVPAHRILDASKVEPVEKLDITEATFRWRLNEDEMATVKLSDGIRVFAADLEKLEKELANRL